MGNPPAKVHNCSRVEWLILASISSHSWRGTVQHLWPPISHIFMETCYNNTCRFTTSSCKVMLQGIHQEVLSFCPWVLSILESISSISMGCVKHIARCWHSKGCTCNIRNRPASLILITRDLVWCSLAYKPLHLTSLLVRPWTLCQRSSTHIRPISRSCSFHIRIQTRSWLPPIPIICSLP